jgi:hypothetical protein
MSLCGGDVNVERQYGCDGLVAMVRNREGVSSLNFCSFCVGYIYTLHMPAHPAAPFAMSPLQYLPPAFPSFISSDSKVQRCV